MKAVEVVKPGEIAMADVPVPAPGTGEALLRVRYAGICGSDMQTFAGTQPFTTYPRSLDTSSRPRWWRSTGRRRT